MEWRIFQTVATAAALQPRPSEMTALTCACLGNGTSFRKKAELPVTKQGKENHQSTPVLTYTSDYELFRSENMVIEGNRTELGNVQMCQCFVIIFLSA
jgi:hypothetical protein